MLHKDGWYLYATVGSHHHYKHPSKKGKVTIPHPRKSIPRGILESIAKQSGLSFK